MTTGSSNSGAAHDPEERENVEPVTTLQLTQLVVLSTPHASSLGALGATILEDLKLLLLGPLIVALFAFGIANLLPKWYTSVVYLNIDEAGARKADALMRSAPVLDKVLSEFKAPQDTLEARRRFLDGNRRIVVAPGDIQMTSNLFRMEYSDRDPRVAQKVNSLFVEAWLELTNPPAEKRKMIEAEIARKDLEVEINFAIDRSTAKGCNVSGRTEFCKANSRRPL